MSSFIRKLWLPLCLLLAACATPPRPLETVDWAAHRSRVAAVDHWQMSGKLGFRSPQQGGSASVNWVQRGENYELNLSGPFGAGAARIAGDGGLATLTSGEDVYQDHPDLMALQLVGAPIPVDALSWWVRGIPAPGAVDGDTLVIDMLGLAQSFSQAGWQLSFDRYQQTAMGALPGMVRGVSGEYSFKLAIAGWQFAGGGSD